MRGGELVVFVGDQIRSGWCRLLDRGFAVDLARDLLIFLVRMILRDHGLEGRGPESDHDHDLVIVNHVTGSEGITCFAGIFRGLLGAWKSYRSEGITCFAGIIRGLLGD